MTLRWSTLLPLAVLGITLTGVLAAPTDALAQSGGSSGVRSAGEILEPYNPVSGGSVDRGSLGSTILRLTTFRGAVAFLLVFVLSFVGLLALLVIVYAGFRYITAFGGDTATAKKAIATALIGIVVIMGAWALVTTVINLGGTNFLPF